MIKAIISNSRRKIFLIGLSHGNLDRLRRDGMEGFICIDGSEHGLSHDIMITAGESEADMLDHLKKFIGPDTKINVDPKLKS
jgi:hypothetical protein